MPTSRDVTLNSLHKRLQSSFLLLKEIPEPPYKVYYEFGFSSAASDLDNPIKPLQDILQKRYDFNDKHIYEMTAKRVKVKKGEEYLLFEINTL